MIYSLHRISWDIRTTIYSIGHRILLDAKSRIEIYSVLNARRNPPYWGLIFPPLTTKSLSFSSLTLDFGLIGIDLPLLVCLLYLPALELVADKRAADRCPYAWSTDRGADHSAPPTAAPPNAPTRAPFSRVAKLPPAQPTIVLRSRTAAQVVMA